MTLDEFIKESTYKESYRESVVFNVKTFIIGLNKIKTYGENGVPEELCVPDFIDVISRRGSALDYAVYMDVLNEYFDQLNESKSSYSSSFKNSVIKRMESFKQTISIIAENGINPSAEEYAEIFKEEE